MPFHIGVDLGRQHSHCSLRDAAGCRLVPVGDHGETGLWLRWSGPTRSERITDRVLRLAGHDQPAAIETIERVVVTLFPELQDGARLGVPPVVVIPSAFGPDCRQAVVEGFARAGVAVPHRHLVERPVAALARWLSEEPDRPQGVACVLDNDRGQISFAAADLDSGRILVSRPLSGHGDDDPAEVRGRLAAAVARLRYLLDVPAADTEPRVGPDSPGPRTLRLDHLVLSGTALDDPRLAALVAHSFGSLVPRIVGDQTAPVLGALALDALRGFTTGWPTLALRVDGRPLPPAEVRSPDGARGVDLTPEDGGPPTEGGALLDLSDGGRPVPIRSGSVDAAGIELPADLREPRIRVFDDGRILVLGRPGTRPLAMRVLWPAPGSPVDHVTVRAIGRRPLVLSRTSGAPLSATTDRPRPATVS